MKRRLLYTLALLFATLQTFAQTYTYNNLNRLTKVVYGNGVTVTYGYDALGNRTSKKVTGATATTFTITANVTPSGSGMVTGGGSFAKGATVELHAIANAGYEFLKWTDGETANPRTVTVTEDKKYTAQFKESTVTPDLIGDIVVDGKVDWLDLDALTYACVTNAPVTKFTDINGDGSLSILDITQLISIISADSDNSVNNNGHQYVDLGLPSGTLWATCNVGAISPEEFGGYYAWAETTPKDVYNWETYEWCNGTVCNNSNTTLTKYCLEGGWGSMDGKSVIEPDDDVAQTNWGGGWRTPTEADFLELINNCESKWETINGVKGRTFTGVNGKSIFLPAAGTKENAKYYSGDGQYWTSSLSISGGHSTNAKHMEFTRSSIELFEEALYGALRYYGLSVRPVITRVQNEQNPTSHMNHDFVNLGLPSGTLWATCNLGASSPEDYGCYYAWAETTSSCSGKTDFSQDTYEYYDGTSMTKYTAVGSLNISDDAATKEWKGKWRMPTRTEIMELENEEYTSCVWTTINGVYGYLITSKVKGYKGNSIFLPAAGYYNKKTLNDVGEQGIYWNSTIRDVSGDGTFGSADCMTFGDTYINKGARNRWRGYSIRPVVSLDAIK